MARVKAVAPAIQPEKAPPPTDFRKLVRHLARCLATSLFGNSLYNAPLWVESGWKWALYFIGSLEIGRWASTIKIIDRL